MVTIYSVTGAPIQIRNVDHVEMATTDRVSVPVLICYDKDHKEVARFFPGGIAGYSESKPAQKAQGGTMDFKVETD